MDLTMTAEAGYNEEDFMDYEEYEEEPAAKKVHKLPFILIGAAIVAAVAGIVIFRKKKKKKNTVKINWED